MLCNPHKSREYTLVDPLGNSQRSIYPSSFPRSIEDDYAGLIEEHPSHGVAVDLQALRDFCNG